MRKLGHALLIGGALTLGSAWTGLSPSAAIAQNLAPAPRIASSAARQPGAATPEPTTPEIVVQPEPTTPPIDVTAPFQPFDSGAAGRPAFPSLSEQGSLNLDGIFRSDKSLFDAPNMATILDRQTMTERAPKDMFEALRNEVGVLMQRTAAGQSSPFIRGLTGQDVLLLMDGVRLNNSTFRTGPNQYFNLIDPGVVQQIEVLHGPASVLYGSDAIGGAINVVTRSADPFAGDYGTGLFTSIFGTADSSLYTRPGVEFWSGATGVYAGASYWNVNNLDTGSGNIGLAPELGRQPFTDYQQNAGDIKITRMLDESTFFTVALQHFEQNNLPRSDRAAPFVFGPPNRGPERPTFFLPQQRELMYTRLQGADLGGWITSYMITFSLQRNKESVTDVQAGNNRVTVSEFDARTAGLQMVFMSDLDWAGRLTYGTELYHDNIRASTIRYNLNGTFNSIRNPQFPDNSWYSRTGVFANWDVDLTEDLLFSTGVRYENVDTSFVLGQFQPANSAEAFKRNFNDVIAQTGLIYKLSDSVRLCAGFSEGFRAPTLDDLASSNVVLQQGQDLPSPNVQPIHSYTYDLGVKFNDEQFRGQFFWYWNDMRDNIVRVPTADGNLKQNFDAFIQGCEMQGEYLFLNGWSVYGNFWYTYSENVAARTYLSRMPPVQGIYGLRWRQDGSWVDLYAWSVRHQDKYAPENVNDARFITGGTPGYTTLNLRLGRSFGEDNQHVVSLNLENLTDKGYRVLGSGVNGAGFNAIFGYQYVR